jgi:hypothetical protein
MLVMVWLEVLWTTLGIQFTGYNPFGDSATNKP